MSLHLETLKKKRCHSFFVPLCRHFVWLYGCWPFLAREYVIFKDNWFMFVSYSVIENCLPPQLHEEMYVFTDFMKSFKSHMKTWIPQPGKSCIKMLLCTTVHKFGVWKIFNVFGLKKKEKNLSYSMFTKAAFIWSNIE